MDIGFENTAGPEKHQAVALRVSGDMAIFHNCAIDGYQDTLYTHSYRQFYRECNITGTIDFVFGDAAAVFQNCMMIVKKPLDNQQCMVTAQGRKDRHSKGALILQGCIITADQEFWATKPMPKSYLGRPWKVFARTIIMQSFIDQNIEPEGWAPWDGSFALDTCYFGEFNNIGPGANTAKRVTWKGFKKISLAEAVSYTPQKYIQGDLWIKTSSIPYDPGLM
ncbi:putative pectinesterase [Helianthus annuus]|uniref:Pectinesterase n=2 Tax=Helianthus annuus TaxID=4232 RepID=A0A9K3DEX7_HELAN|nr:putative pectinesterase [Helianthus annuus]